MRIVPVLSLVLCLAACNRGIQTKDAVRQGVVEYLQSRQMNMGSMEVSVASVQFNGNRADATIAFAPKGGDPAQGMSIQYQLEQRGGKWVVVGRKDTGGAPHAGAMSGAGAGNPAGGAAPAPEAQNPHSGGAQMPAPESLPPAGKKE
ncbi:MAG: hypothetical protein ABSC23_04420 [Bryobacteraceae bacterium]